MKKHTYICNLCHSEFREESVNNIVGFVFDGPRSATPTVPRDCETHICISCIEVVKRLAALLPKQD